MTYIDDYLTKLETAIRNLSREDLNASMDLIIQAWQNDKQIFVIGNGGSAATASHMMNDLNKLTIVPGQPRFRVLALTDNMPLVTAWGNDSSYNVTFAEPMRNFMREGDLLIAISTSGNSPNIIEAVKVAQTELGATVIGWVGDKGGKLAEMADQVVKFPDPHIGRQEDGHLIFNHAIANAIHDRLSKSA